MQTTGHYFPEDGNILSGTVCCMELLCGLVVRVLGYRSGGPGSIPGTTRFSGGGGGEKEKGSGSGTGSTQPREYNWGATSPTSGGRSASMVRSRTQTMEFFFLFSLFCVDTFLYKGGHAIPQEFSSWLPILVALVQSQVRSCGICGQSGTWAGFLRVLHFPLLSLIPRTAPHITVNWILRGHTKETLGSINSSELLNRPRYC
jgi:hypothetical protein